MFERFRALGLAGLTALAAGGAGGVPTLIHGDLYTGVAAFDRAVAADGGVVDTQPLSGLRDGVARWVFEDFTVSTPNGQVRFIEPDYHRLRQSGQTGALSGWAFGLSVNQPAPMWGLTFDFDEPINAFGLEVGDWGTCCFPSALYVAFDDGPPIELATARNKYDNPGYRAYGVFTSFVGAVDRDQRYSRVSFYGAGIGEYMVGGGTVRWALAPVEPLDPVDELDGQVPEPASWVLVVSAIVAMDLAARRGRRAAMTWARRERAARLA